MSEKNVETVEAELIETKEEKVNKLTVLDKPLATEMILQVARSTPIVKKQDVKFLQKHAKQLNKVMTNTFIWRTDTQKRQIISDAFHPTLPSKFHQAILENKVFFQELVRLTKDAEEIKLDIEDLGLDIKKSKEDQLTMDTNSIAFQKEDVKQRRLELQLKYKMFNLNEAQIAADYRMKEIRGWIDIEKKLYKQMRDQGMTDKEIWDKDISEVEAEFFMFLNNLHGVKVTKDGGEYQNLVGLARFGVQSAKEMGKFEDWKKRCNIMQLEALLMLGEITPEEAKQIADGLKK